MHISYRFVLLLMLFPILGTSQSKREHTETFDMDKNPEIKLDLSHATIKVSTWNKNKVEVKATLTSDNLTQEEFDEIYEAYEIKVLGNSKRVEISSHSPQKSRIKGMVIRKVASPLSPQTPPRVKGEDESLKGKASSSLEDVSPPSPPEAPSFFNFDYEAFKEDGKAYLEKFKEQIQSSSFREEMEEFRETMLEWRRDVLHKRKELIDRGISGMAEINPDSIFFLKRFRSNSRDSLNISSKSIKKIIEIKVPKSATFDVDLMHSSLDAESMENLKANLRYSDMTVKTLSGEASELKLNYSNLEVNSADQLKLDLVFSKRVNINDVHDLHVKSKMSQLEVKNLKNQAFIQGSYGELTIHEIHPKFSLIDIQLEKSSANLKLPKTSNFNFYAKSSNSKFNMNSDLDLKMTKSFDNVIYTNSATKTDTQRLSLNVDYSTVTLN